MRKWDENYTRVSLGWSSRCNFLMCTFLFVCETHFSDVDVTVYRRLQKFDLDGCQNEIHFSQTDTFDVTQSENFHCHFVRFFFKWALDVVGVDGVVATVNCRRLKNETMTRIYRATESTKNEWNFAHTAKVDTRSINQVRSDNKMTSEDSAHDVACHSYLFWCDAQSKYVRFENDSVWFECCWRDTLVASLQSYASLRESRDERPNKRGKGEKRSA